MHIETIAFTTKPSPLTGGHGRSNEDVERRLIPAGEATELSDEQLAAWVIARAAQKPGRAERLRHLGREAVLRLSFLGNCIRLRSVSRAKWVLDFDRALK